MDNALVSRIQKFTLNARHLLETEATGQLEGLYGWMPNGNFSDPSSYPAIGSLDEAKQTRDALERYVEEEKEAGVDAGAARKKLVRETAFTWLNRFVALKMMEERGLLKMSVSRLHESKSYVYWLTDGLDPEADRLDRAGDLPVNAMGEGPRQVAYRRFLLWQCANLSKDVPVLFDPNDLPSRLFPRPVVLRDLVHEITAPEMTEAWAAGNEETIGWLYQGFNAQEKALVKDSFKKGLKITVEGIAPITGTYTPKWIVKQIVENSLGELWLEYHPDSYLREKMTYWIPSGLTKQRPFKPVKEIKFLDPACGSFHFGLVAFDLLFEMYREELEKAGEKGWPENPSVSDISEIPEAIVRNNIYGIDLDLRAIQLSAIALFLKSRTLNPKCSFKDKNLVCANIESITGGRLEGFIDQGTFSHPILKRILRELAVRLKDSDNLGSLIRLEKELNRLVQTEREKASVNRQIKFDNLPDLDREAFLSLREFESFFENLESEVQCQLDLFVSSSNSKKIYQTHFFHEASKGLRLLKLLRRRYDIVATNPPYLDSGDYNAVHKTYLKKEYPTAKRNLFAAFIERCLELSVENGFVAMITGQSFMFLPTFEGFRKQVTAQSYVHVLAQHDYHLFAERVDTTSFVLRKEPNEKARREREGVFFRLVKEKNADSKRRMFEEALDAYRSTGSHPKVFMASPADFEPIPGKPWIYWLTERMTGLFSKLQLIESVAKPRQGLATADNNRFLRLWWEVGKSKIGFGKTSCEDANKSVDRWFPYMKGGTPIPWWGNQSFVLNWYKDGKELYAFRPTSVIRNPSFYFRPGVTWSDVSSKGFAARLSPGGFIHDVKGMTCFPLEQDIHFVLGLLNSRFAKFILAALNPTISNQVGDVERLPVSDKKSETIDALVADCVELARPDSRESETTWEFVQPLESLEILNARKARMSEKEAAINKEASRLYGLTEEDLAAIDLELSDVENEATPETAEEEKPEEEGTSSFLITEREWARRWITYGAGIALGRFEIGVEGGLGCGRFSHQTAEKLRELGASDGILVNDPGHPLDLSRRTFETLETMLGASEARRRIQAALGGGNPQESLAAWFDRFSGTADSSFWKDHFKKYRNRPIYWPLQSPKKLFTVWVFQERFTRDTLFQAKNAIVEPRIRLAENRIKDLDTRAGEEKSTRLTKDRILDLLEDLKKFSETLRLVAEKSYTPYIDDGVLLNAAPLHSLLPSWPEAAKAWKELEKGEYDWARQAMAYWPKRVREQCAKNRSFAIAQGLESLCPPEESGKHSESGRRRSRKTREV